MKKLNYNYLLYSIYIIQHNEQYVEQIFVSMERL
jgi:hypothetical protein